MDIYAGTSGFSYKEWKGFFYPERLPANAMLAHYAQQLPAVEINNTFYRLPRTSQLEQWSAKVPEAFRFSLKASRRITHMKRLADCRAETDYLFKTIGVLGDRLGAVLFQLPPNFQKDEPRLKAFIETLPEDVRVALEFRHDSWFDQPILDMLSARGLALVVNDSDEKPVSELTRTADWAYLRLRRSEYSETELSEWLARLRGAQLEEAHVFFKHEAEGAGPRMAQQFLGLVGSA